MSKIAFIYPGQGAQKAGMGRDFYENSPLAAKLYDQASQALGLDMKVLDKNNEEIDLKKLNLTSDTRKVQDMKGRYLLLFANQWSINWALEHNEGLQLSEFSRN